MTRPDGSQEPSTNTSGTTPGSTRTRTLKEIYLEAALESQAHALRKALEIDILLREDNIKLRNRIADLEQQNTSLLDRLNEHWPASYNA